MKKLLLFAVLALTLSGCIKEGDRVKCGDRFNITCYGNSPDCGIYVFTDKQTGQEFLFVKVGYGAGLAPIQTQK